MRNLTVLPLLFLPGLLLAQAPANIDTAFANRHELRIPFKNGPDAQNLKQLQLFVSTDEGRTWLPRATVAPDQQKFQFTAERDGIYWFSVQSLDLQGKLNPPSMDKALASLRVIVDTQPPVVQVQALAPRPGEVGVAWTIRDDYFDPAGPDAVRVEFRLVGGVTWQALAIPPGATQFYWNPRSNSQVEVRVRARDRAGNVGEGATTVSLSGAGQGYVPAGPEVQQPWNGAQESDLAKLGATERRFVNARKVAISCELKDFGPSGVSLIELWWTQDARGWHKGPQDFRPTPANEQEKQSFSFEVTTDGVYGITLLARSGVGLGDRPPQIGDRPQMWIEVDTVKPIVKLLNVVVGTGPDKGKLTVNWDAKDKNLAKEPITLTYKSTNGSWERFADKLPNNGRHIWTLPKEDLPYQFYVKVEAADLAGNIGEAITPEVVKVDLATPKVRILNIEPSGK
jgi:hypothetical protein